MLNEPTSPLSLLRNAPRHLFFTGKGGVGKTSLACACALALADAGRRVLIVSTDPASNLDEMLGLALTDRPRPVPGAPGLQAMNIDPQAAAEAYRARVLAQLEGDADEREQVREQLSGACTTEIAAFDEFAGLLVDAAADVEHVVFDTAPTGHTLRLLSLPKAWTGFLEANQRGASCLGPHSGLKMQESRFRAAMQAIGDPAQTRLVLVTRPETPALREAARSHDELRALGLANQWLAVNGELQDDEAVDDPVAAALRRQQRAALAAMPAPLAVLPRDAVALRGFDMVGLPALRALLSPGVAPPVAVQTGVDEPAPGLGTLQALVEQLAEQPQGLVMVMGKGGVGKTTIAAALAVALAERGRSVHLSTTDPAAHLAATIDGALPLLTVDRIDPQAETQRYVDKILATRGRGLDAAGRALLLEDLRSPCTEEVAVFHAFSHIVAESRSQFVVLDTAPTGHTLLLMDATGAYHRQMTQAFEGSGPGTRVVTPLMRLRDAGHTRIVLVTLPETTPVSEAAALQQDLRRAGIEPWAWVVNRCLSGSGTRSPVLAARMRGERAQFARITGGLAARTALVPWQAEPPVGLAALRRLAAAP